MPPKRKGRPAKTPGGMNDDVKNTGESSAPMIRKRASNKRGNAGKTARNAVPDVYREMLAESVAEQSNIPERPLKKRRVGSRVAPGTAVPPREQKTTDEEDEFEFEDVIGPEVTNGSSNDDGTSKRQAQTAYRDSDEESDNESVGWNNFDFGTLPQNEEPTGDLELTFKTTETTPAKVRASPRRRQSTKAEKVARVETHRMHVLCLLSHIDRRNDWCNDLDVQRALKSLLDKKVLADLRPKSDLSQFGKTEFLKRGLEKVGRLWRAKFTITARGLRRALWADDQEDLENANKSDFKAAAKSLKGSRDLGAQLYCALLRSAGLDVRLVFSLQPLFFASGGPSMSKGYVPAFKENNTNANEQEPQSSSMLPRPAGFGENLLNFPGIYSSPRRRLGHPSAADYNAPEMRAPPPRLPPKPKPKPITESPYPVFWVEVLDEAHQKWLPVDPLVTDTIAKPRAFEPPMADRENNMSYVVAFDDGGNARDVTKRYTKAFNSKTRKTRIEATPGGDKWWRKTMKAYSRGPKSDLDQIEDIELAANEAREPMPKNIMDFKDHPVYALERHLKRNELLVATREVGKVAAGRDSSLPGGKKLENVYRRRDVKIARSADAWYRLGRDIKMGEQPVKTVPAKRRPDDDAFDDGINERPGTNLYTQDQTETYEAPPVVNGQIPKNSFGNIDVYVPSMVPSGGVHLRHDDASRAARLLGIDFAEALTGFDFKGRHGTAVFKGVVVAIEFREAVEAVIDGFRDERDRERKQRRQLAVLNMWKRFVIGLRIKERVDAYAFKGEESDAQHQTADKNEESDDSNDEYVDDDVDDDEMGGGFLPE
ncbi:hypothetical protein HYALB_00004692 [Hymenoscyphus albidus]|uniref:Rad4-domain-containing protein n=1 Tax=Hymenoscyphus albidus TaxID=595503 RepID=A0A9N9LP19_9HELO|nr:hypothetical protein HYALB_00004692 [Hymenoscyphus albidus]